MIAPPAPSSPADVTPAGSPEVGQAVTLAAAARRAERRRHLLLGHLLVLLQLAVIAAGHAGLLPVVPRVVAWVG